MTPIERAEAIANKFEHRVLVGEETRIESKETILAMRTAARCIRAVIEASKEENWDSEGGWPMFAFKDANGKCGPEFFLNALTGETNDKA